jgi:hypothetical protein
VHELELFVPEVKTSTPTFPFLQYLDGSPDFERKFSSYSLRYTVARNFSVTKSFFLTLGGGLNPYYIKTEAFPVADNSYYNSYNTWGVSINLLPGLGIAASKHLSFMLDTPIKIFDYYRFVWDVHNPAIPIRQQKMPADETKFFMNAFTMRLGMKYVFGA